MKKNWLLILCALLLFSAATFSAAAAPPYTPGDVDGDGVVTSGDARLALRRSVQLENYKEGSAAFLACDADGDGTVTSGDARLILRASVGLEQLPAAQPQHTHQFTEKKVAPTCTESGYTERTCSICGLKERTDVVPPAGHRLTKVAAVAPTEEKDGILEHYHCGVCGGNFSDAKGLKALASVTVPKTSQKQLSSSELFKLAKRFTVEITAYGADFISTGTGFFLSEDGKILTNYHVIKDTNRIEALDCDGRSHPVKMVLAADSFKDLAVLQIEGTFTAAVLNREDYDTGDKVYALGSSDGLTYSFSDGIISTRSRVVKEYNPDMTYIQTTAPISHGNSGGPLIDEYGRVIGVNTWTRTTGQNLNFAIPVFYLDQLDFSSPIPPSDLNKREPVTGSITVPYKSLNLKTGACAFFPLTVKTSVDDVTVSYAVDSNDINCVWSHWDGDDVILIIFANYPCSTVPVTVYLDDNPEIRATFTVTVSDTQGSANYVGLPVPDFGAMTGVSPFDASYNGQVVGGNDTWYIRYDSYDLYQKGYEKISSCRDPFFAALEKNGFRKDDFSEDEDTMTWFYVKGDILVMYQLHFNEENACDVTLIALSYPS